MKHTILNAVRVGSSNFYGMMEELAKAHEEFEMSELKQRLEQNWKVDEVKVVKRRPRFKVPVSVVIRCMGKELILSWEEYQEHGKGWTIVRKIYK